MQDSRINMKPHARSITTFNCEGLVRVREQYDHIEKKRKKRILEIGHFKHSGRLSSRKPEIKNRKASEKENCILIIYISIHVAYTPYYSSQYSHPAEKGILFESSQILPILSLPTQY